MTVNTPPNVGRDPTITSELASDIEILIASEHMVQAAPLRAVLESTIHILMSVRDETTEDDSLLELAKLCFRICQALTAATKGRGAGDLGGLSTEEVEDLGRTLRHIESGARERTNSPQDRRGSNTNFDGGCVIKWRAELCRILDVFDAVKSDESAARSPVLRSSNDNDFPLNPQVSQPIVADSSVALPVPPGEGNPVSELPHLPDAYQGALQRLVGGALPRNELTALIETVVSKIDSAKIGEYLKRSDVQAFIDVIDQALDSHNLSSRTRRKCVKSLYKTCSSNALLPRSLRFELLGIPMGDDDPEDRGGFANVFKRECRGREVAVKVLRVNSQQLQEMTERFYKEVITWKSLRHPNVLPLLGAATAENQLAMVSEWMKNGNINQFVAANPGVNRIKLLVDVATGVTHLHQHEMVHGDLKGANILIDQTDNARLTDFGFLVIRPDTTNITSSHSFLQGGTYRWTSPELLDPQEFGLQDNGPTASSDCYALGMVIYEVLSGRVPFYHCEGDTDYNIVSKVIEGERPKRPQGTEGMWFTDYIWSILEQCWSSKRSDRPRVRDVRRSLEKIGTWTPSRPELIVGPPAGNLSDEARTHDGGTSGTSQTNLTQAPQQHPPKVPSRDVPECLSLGASVSNLSFSEESGTILERQSSSDSLSQNTTLGGRSTHSRQEIQSQSNVSVSGSERTVRIHEGLPKRESHGGGVVGRVRTLFKKVFR